ncbi:MAG: transposase [Chromatiaceae bacterium]|nr:transposase [Chromatiaceae bacterium]
MIAVQTTTEETRPWYVRPDPVPGFTKKALVEWANRVLAPEALIVFVSDDPACFAAAAERAAGHERVVVGTRKSSNWGCLHIG